MYCVYRHTCPNGKCYIGITGQEPLKRWDGGRGYQKAKLFYRAIQKYGWDNIKHEILLDGLTKEKACQKEIELIAEHKSNNHDYGYNVSSGGESGNAGVTASEETRHKMSLARKGAKRKPLSEETKEKLRVANTGKKATPEARVKMSLARKGIKRGALSLEARRKISESRKGITSPNKGRTGANNPCSLPVCQYTMDMTFIKTFAGLCEAARETNISHADISKCCKGKRKSAGGYVWEYQTKTNCI